MMIRALILTLAVLAAGSPATALAATAAVSGSTLTYTADSGEKNDVTVALENGGMDYRISDAGSKTSGTLTVTPGSGCIPAGAAAVACAASGITSVAIALGDEDDKAAVVPLLPTTIDGGAGNDELTGTDAADRLIGGNGADVLHGGGGDDRLDGGEGDDVLDGGEGNDVLDGGPGDDRLSGGGGDDVLLAGPGADVMSGGAGEDLADYSSRSEGVTVTLDGEANDGRPGERDNVGTDVEDVTGGSGNDTILGGAADNVLTGGPGDDSLDGGAGNDTLYGGKGDDLLTGGQGDDRLDGGAGNDGLSGGAGADDMSGGPGSDFVGYIGRTTGVNVTLDDQRDDGGPGEGDNAHSDIEGIYGGNGDDTLRGSDAPNIIVGGAGNDLIDGGGGDDIIAGGPGSDVLRGGPGTDAVSYADAESSVTVTLDGLANDGARGENDLVAGDVENVYGGDGPDRLVGDDGPNLLVGGGGDDVLIGGGGVDTLVGGDGDDQFDSVDGGTDLIDCGAGTDFVHMDAGDAASAECEQTLMDIQFQVPPAGLRAARSGVVRVPIACPAPAGCAGWVTLASGDGKLDLGIGSFELANGEDGLVEIELSRRNFALLKKKKKQGLAVLATGVVRDAQGRTTATSASFKLTSPKAAKKKHKKHTKRKKKRKKAGSRAAMLSPPPPSPNEAAAARDTWRLIGLLRLPAGATASPDDPTGDRASLSSPGIGPVATPTVVTAHKFWRIPGPPDAVVRWIETYRPPGSRLVSRAGGGPGAGSQPLAVAFEFRPVRNTLGRRWLAVTVADAGDGSTALRADGQVVWLLRRPAASRIPRGAVSVTIARLRFDRRLGSSLSLRDPAKVRRVVRVVNRLERAQPGVRLCPRDLGYVLRLTFFGRRHAGPLAVARVYPGGCASVWLTGIGKEQIELSDGHELLRCLERLLGRRLLPSGS